MENLTAGNRLLFMYHSHGRTPPPPPRKFSGSAHDSTACAQTVLHGPSNKQETVCLTWIIIHTGDRLLYSTDWRQASIYGPLFRLETGRSTCTITQNGDKLMYMENPTELRQVALHGQSYILESDCCTWTTRRIL